MIKRYLAKRNNPWELLVFALLVFVPGVVMLLQKEPMVAFPPPSSRFEQFTIEVISPNVAHIFGILAISFSSLIVIFYFYARQAIARDLQAGDERSADKDI